MAYSDLFGPANAAQLDALVLQKRFFSASTSRIACDACVEVRVGDSAGASGREEQKFNAMVEKQLKVEQARFAQSQDRRRQAEAEEMAVRQQLEDAQRELFEAEQHLAEEAAQATLIKNENAFSIPNALW
jgi:hypothetical protein